MQEAQLALTDGDRGGYHMAEESNSTANAYMDDDDYAASVNVRPLSSRVESTGCVCGWSASMNSIWKRLREEEHFAQCEALRSMVSGSLSNRQQALTINSEVLFATEQEVSLAQRELYRRFYSRIIADADIESANPDVILVSGENDEIPTHKILIGAHSEYFNTYLHSAWFKRGSEQDLCSSDSLSGAVHTDRESPPRPGLLVSASAAEQQLPSVDTKDDDELPLPAVMTRASAPRKVSMSSCRTETLAAFVRYCYCGSYRAKKNGQLGSFGAENGLETGVPVDDATNSCKIHSSSTELDTTGGTSAATASVSRKEMQGFLIPLMELSHQLMAHGLLSAVLEEIGQKISRDSVCELLVKSIELDLKPLREKCMSYAAQCVYISNSNGSGSGGISEQAARRTGVRGFEHLPPHLQEGIQMLQRCYARYRQYNTKDGSYSSCTGVEGDGNDGQRELISCREIISIIENVIEENSERFETATDRMQQEIDAFKEALRRQGLLRQYPGILLRGVGEGEDAGLPKSLVEWKDRLVKVQGWLRKQGDSIENQKRFYREQKEALGASENNVVEYEDAGEEVGSADDGDERGSDGGYK